jgi:hypothetical protein
MMRFAAGVVAVLLIQTSSAFAASRSERPADASAVETTASIDTAAGRAPTLSSSEIAAIQYHDPLIEDALGARCQTRAGVFAVSPQRPVDTTCVVNGLPGFMLP